MQNTLGGKGRFSENKQNLPVKKETKSDQKCSIERCKAEEKATNYVDYLPTDANTESGLSVQNDNNLGKILQFFLVNLILKFRGV